MIETAGAVDPAQLPPFVQVVGDPERRRVAVQSNIPDPLAVLRFLALGQIEFLTHLHEEYDVVPKRAVVMADGSPAPPPAAKPAAEASKTGALMLAALQRANGALEYACMPGIWPDDLGEVLEQTKAAIKAGQALFVEG